jgi:hypothetical protein
MMGGLFNGRPQNCSPIRDLLIHFVLSTQKHGKSRVIFLNFLLLFLFPFLGNTWPYKFTSPGNDSDRIDFIFTKGKQLKAIQAFIYPNSSDELMEWPSDHYALIVDYILFRQRN